MIEEGKYCIDVMKKHFNKELLMAKEDNKDWKNSTRCSVCDTKYRGSEYRDCNISVKWNPKVPVVFHNLKSYFYFIRQELGKFDLKINVIPNGLQKYISFGINNKLSITDIFQFLSSHKEI